jgi:hypothetical protein
VSVVTCAAALLSLVGRSAWWATIFGWLPMMLIGKLTFQTGGLAVLLAAVSVILGLRATTRPSSTSTPPAVQNKTEWPEH